MEASKCIQPGRRVREYPRAFDVDVYMQRIAVEYEFPVYFTSDVFSPNNQSLVGAVSRKEPTRRHRLLFVVEQEVAGHWPHLIEDIGEYVRYHHEALELVASPLVLTGAESIKNDPSSMERLHSYLHEHAIDRQSFVVCVGGGAIQDAVGYAAATAHRGVRLVRIPTTVLSQNDSGVGVKNSVNAFGKKNFLGTFAPPFAVINDIRFIETLSARDRIAGMSEAVKVALIRDAAFFEWLEEHVVALRLFEPDVMARMIRWCAEIHLRHIGTSGDPFEFGSARPLDFGHWAAHKLESLTENRLRHGEAVAIGLALDTVYAAEAGYLEPDALERTLSLLERLGFRLWDEAFELCAPNGQLQVLDGLAEFREHLGGELTVTLLRGIGHGFEVHEIEEEGMLASIDWLRQRDAAR